jgi:hypothetical protein
VNHVSLDFPGFSVAASILFVSLAALYCSVIVLNMDFEHSTDMEKAE